MQTSKYTLHQTMIVDDPCVLLVEVSLLPHNLIIEVSPLGERMGRRLIKMWEGCSEPPQDVLFKP